LLITVEVRALVEACRPTTLVAIAITASLGFAREVGVVKTLLAAHPVLLEAGGRHEGLGWSVGRHAHAGAGGAQGHEGGQGGGGTGHGGGGGADLSRGSVTEARPAPTLPVCPPLAVPLLVPITSVPFSISFSAAAPLRTKFVLGGTEALVLVTTATTPHPLATCQNDM
jgi:hypothetical protein